MVMKKFKTYTLAALVALSLVGTAIADGHRDFHGHDYDYDHDHGRRNYGYRDYIVPFAFGVAVGTIATYEVVRGHYEYRTEQYWVPGYQRVIPAIDGYGNPYTSVTWIEGHYEVRTVKVWVNY